MPPTDGTENSAIPSTVNNAASQTDTPKTIKRKGVATLSGKEARRARRAQDAKISSLAIVIGVIAGYGAVGFYLAIDWLTLFLFGADEKTLATGAKSLEWWHLLVAPVAAGLVVGQLLRFMDGNRAQGIPHVMEAAVLKEGRLPLRKGLMSAIITMISIGGGASTGREGPVVHLGATLAAVFTRYFNLNRESARTLLGCGAAAAVAASFNAPIAGVFFALEVVLGHYALGAFAPIVLSAVAGTLVARTHIGDLPVFSVGSYEITSMLEFPAFILLGVAAAILSAAFMQAMAWGEDWRDKVLPLPYWLQPAFGGLIIGAMALWHPEILGVGYEATVQAITGGYGLMIIVPLLILKTAAVVISITFRFGGGVFSPSIVMGALLGGAFGLVAADAAPALASSEGLYAIVGMGAVASAILGAPISTVLIVFELTGDYNVAIAVMVASATASLIVTYFKDGSLFHQQLRMRGIHLIGGRATHLLEGETVGDYMTHDFATMAPTATLKQACDLLPITLDSHFVVTDTDGSYQGTVSLARLPSISDLNEEAPIAPYVDWSTEAFPKSMKMGKALEMMEETGIDMMPVIAGNGIMTVVGVIHYRTIMKAYNRSLLFAKGADPHPQRD